MMQWCVLTTSGQNLCESVSESDRLSRLAVGVIRGRGRGREPPRRRPTQGCVQRGVGMGWGTARPPNLTTPNERRLPCQRRLQHNVWGRSDRTRRDQIRTSGYEIVHWCLRHGWINRSSRAASHGAWSRHWQRRRRPPTGREGVGMGDRGGSAVTIETGAIWSG